MPGFANPQNLNRYSYVSNNPLRYTDPTGHMMSDGGGGGNCDLNCVHVHNQNNNHGVGGGNGGHHNERKGSLVSGVPEGECSGPGCPIISSSPSGQGCVYTNYCYNPPEEPEPNPSWPDFYVLEGGVPVVWITGVDVAITFDKYKRVYLGIGPSAGTSPAFGLDINLSVSGGYIQDDNTTPKEANAFISKWSGNGCAGFVVGGCGSNGNPFGGGLDDANDWAVQGGAFTPQAGVAFPYSWQIYP